VLRWTRLQAFVFLDLNPTNQPLSTIQPTAQFKAIVCIQAKKEAKNHPLREKNTSTMQLLTLALLATAATASSLQKRCTPVYDPDVPHGYYPPAPCWQSFSPACQPYLAQGTEMTVDAKHRLAVVYGVDEYCAAEIAEELSREAAGKKNFGWVKKHGNLTFIKGGILVISGMSEEAVVRYQKLDYLKM